MVAKSRSEIGLKGFACWEKLLEDGSTFILTQTHTMNYAAFSKSFNLVSFDQGTIPVTHSLAYIGRSSIVISSKVSLDSSKDVIETSDVQYVYVDKLSKMAKPLPEWFTSRYKDSKEQEKPGRFEPFISPPSSARTKNVMVSEDKIDRFGHTNNLHYIRYAFEALGITEMDQTSPPWNKINSVSILHSAQSFLSDLLDVSTWTVCEKAFCLIENKQGKVAHIKFFIKSLS